MTADTAQQAAQLLIGKILPLIPIVLILGLFRAWLSSPKVKGAIGETITTIGALRKLDPLVYSVHQDVYVPRPDGKGTTQIDHVIVSSFAVFVIETKNMKGWIFGDEKSKQWTQTLYRKKYRFQNPLHQNQLHVNALANALQIPKEKLESIVFFVGDVTLKTQLPPNVLTSGLRSYLLGHRVQRLSADECERIRAGLATLNPGKKRAAVAKAHLETVAMRKATQTSRG